MRCNFNLHRFFSSVFLCLLIAMPKAKSEDNLASQDDWLALVHYQPKWSGGFESTLDTPNFFLSPDGKYNPKAELEATIALFQSNDYEKQCLFPARFRYLQKHNLTQAKFPKCKEYQQFYHDLRPKGITLLFTDANMNNPSSLFGHTMIRVDTARKGTQLLGHGITYGAYMGDNPSPLYPILGLFGGYYGGFTVKPYYEVVNTYNNFENRDVWEVNLNFSREELDYFIAHSWEVGQAQSRYYFLTRNCSYLLLENLDAVRPSLKLAQQFPVQVIPLDTMKAAQKIPNLNKGINYRPSRQSKIRYRYKMMNDKQKQAYLNAIKMHNYKIDGLNDSEKADVLETAYQYVQYQYVAHKTELAQYRKESFELLKERNQIKAPNAIAGLKWNKEPMKAHDAKRLVVGIGSKKGEGFQETVFRPAYHSWTDDSYGLVQGAEINFLNTAIRHYDRQDKYVLQNLDILTLRSVAPIDAMFAPISFQVLWNVGREYNPETDEEGYTTNLKSGGGATWRLTDKVWVYTMANAQAAYGGFIKDNVYGAVSGEAGILADFDKWRLWLKAEKTYASQQWKNSSIYYAEGAYSISRNWAIAADYSFQDNAKGQNVEEFMTSIRHYF